MKFFKIEERQLLLQSVTTQKTTPWLIFSTTCVTLPDGVGLIYYFYFFFYIFVFQGVPGSVKTFLKSDIYYLPSDQTNERADMIDKALASARLFWPKVKNAMPLIVERLTEVYGASWPELYKTYARGV